MKSPGGESVEPRIDRVTTLTCHVSGTFYRAVETAHRNSSLRGSRLPGRYSAAGEPTLYLSASRDGVAAAMLAHGGAERDQVVLAYNVEADGVVDLRDPDAVDAAGVKVQDAAAPWQQVVAAGGEPPSWRVRHRLEDQGARGLIDPSRQRPGLWHLVLFAWNAPGEPHVLPVSD